MAMDLTDNTPQPPYCEKFMSSGQLPTNSGSLLMGPVPVDLKEVVYDFIFMYLPRIFIAYLLSLVPTNAHTHTHTQTEKLQHIGQI
jgi:hypothetical protein